MISLLGKIEAAREIVESIAIPLGIEKNLRKDASAKMSHYSTKIEGNRLTLKQTKKLLSGENILARDIDKREVMNYYDCLEWIHKISKTKKEIHENDIRKMHGFIQKGIVKGKLRGNYREAQNVIYDSANRKVIYFPPEAKDVPAFMAAFIMWLKREREMHPVIKAGIAHYQLAAIHPFMDGNGRTARALATLVLYMEKYGLKEFYSLEEYYAEDLKGYYAALHACQGNAYYDNPTPDITKWLEYFIKGVTIIFEEIKEKASAVAQKQGDISKKRDIKLLQFIGPREKRILNYFRSHLQLRTKNLCGVFHIKERTARDLLTKWIDMKMIKKQGGGKRDAYYVLSESYRRLID